VFTIYRKGSSRDKVGEFSSADLKYAYRTRETTDAASPAIGDYRSMGRTIFTKRIVVKALEERDIEKIRHISRHFFAVSGIYSRACRYMAYLPTYDYTLTPNITKYNSRERLMEDFTRALKFVDSMNLKTKLSEISLTAIIDGAYYGYLKTQGNRAVIQDLPVDYCRSYYKINGISVVEFNLDYFDRNFKTVEHKKTVLRNMPQEIAEMYVRWKNNEEVSLSKEGRGNWMTLDIVRAFKITLNKDDAPLFSHALPQIIDLDDLQGIQKKKAESQLLKIMVQKIPLDKNGEFIFDMEEAKAMHANAVRMLARAINVDVLTTFADSELLDLEERRTNASTDNERWERSTFSELGISQQLFATEGNIALEKSILNDESIAMQLLYQYQDWLNYILHNKFIQNSSEYVFDIWFPRLTQHNRADMARLYKEQAALGYSKVLPALALGQSQSNFLSSILFENEFLDLASVMVPVKMASTQSGKASGDGAGRPAKADDQKSDKTLANEASGG
jgi:hypothetical protein